MTATRICPICGKEFTPRPNQKYCSPACKSTHYYREYEERKAAREKIERLEKEAKEKDAIIDWLSDALAWFGKAFENSGHGPVPVEIDGIGCADYWKEKAQEGVKNNDNA